MLKPFNTRANEASVKILLKFQLLKKYGTHMTILNHGKQCLIFPTPAEAIYAVTDRRPRRFTRAAACPAPIQPMAAAPASAKADM